MEKIIRYSYYDRDWKGGQVIAIIDDGKHGSYYSKTAKDDMGHDLYLCVAFFSNKATARKMADDLNDGKITLSQAIDKVLKSQAKWQANIGKRKGIVPCPDCGEEQMVYFGATKEQLAEKKRLEDNLTKIVEERSSKRSA